MDSEPHEALGTQGSLVPPHCYLSLEVAGKEKGDDPLTYCGLSATKKYFFFFIYFEAVSHRV